VKIVDDLVLVGAYVAGFFAMLGVGALCVTARDAIRRIF
jgi:hypothetical protein